MLVHQGGKWTPTYELCTESYHKIVQSYSHLYNAGLAAVAECLVKGKEMLNKVLIEVWVISASANESF